METKERKEKTKRKREKKKVSRCPSSMVECTGCDMETSKACATETVTHEQALRWIKGVFRETEGWRERERKKTEMAKSLHHIEQGAPTPPPPAP